MSKTQQRNNPYSFKKILHAFGFHDDLELASWIEDSARSFRQTAHERSSLGVQPPPVQQDFGKTLFYTLFDKAAHNEGIHKDSELYKKTREIFEHSINVDSTTLAYTKEWDEFFLRAMDAEAFMHPEHNPAIIEMDFSNMGGANLAIGRNNVDRAVGIIVAIYENALNEQGIQSVKVRRGGDEVRFYALCENENALRRAIQKAEKTTQQLVDDLGLTNLQHLKSADPAKAGFGAGAGYIMLANYQDSSQKLGEAVSGDLDKKIKEAKQEQAQHISRQASDLIKPESFAANQTAIANTLEKFEAANPPLVGMHDIPPSPSLFENLDLTQFHGDAYAAREAYIQEHHPNSELLRYAVELMNTRDTTTGLKGRKGLLEALEYHAQHRVPESHITLFETTNLGGLNEILGNHEQVDTVIHAFAKRLEEKVHTFVGDKRQAHAQLYSFGGSRFCLVSDGLDNSQLKNLCNEVCEDLIKTADLPDDIKEKLPLATNPKRQVMDTKTGRMGPEKGVQVLCTSIPLPEEYKNHAVNNDGVDLDAVYYKKPAYRPLDLLEALSDTAARQPIRLHGVNQAHASDYTCIVGNSSTPAHSFSIPRQFIEHAGTEQLNPIHLKQHTGIADKAVAQAFKGDSNIRALSEQPYAHVNYKHTVISNPEYIARLSQNPPQLTHQR